MSSYSGSGYNYGSISNPQNKVSQGPSSFGKVDLRKGGGAGGGLWASMSRSPLAWLGGFLLFCAVISTAVWVTLDSLGSTSSSNVVDVEEGVNSVFGSKPHIVYILADDLGWNSIGYEDYDLSFTTPTLTTMAKEGIIMSSFYAQEVCTPARAALLTGRNPLSVGMQYSMVQTAMPWGLDLKETLIAEVLKDNNYTTHMLGKWHLGHYTPRMLPTARGFETFTGFLNGESYYWSKRNPDHTTFHDLMYSTEDCYTPYESDDMHDYSTFFYRDKAKELIRQHNTSDSSLFLFMSFQAVHDPFVDIGIHEKGIPKEYLQEDVYNQIISSVKGRKRRQYAMALSLMDDAVSDIIDSLDTAGMLDNTVVIFSSDNGGCYGAGGKNGPLRGTKGSLFEGGTKVDSFMWSKKLPARVQGKVYENLFHITDWFPTMLAISGITYTPEDGYELDGVNHLPSLLYGESTPRETMLYNFYYNVDYYAFDMWINGSFAVRNTQYKLMHTFNSSVYGVWYQPEDVLDDDDAITTETRCSSSSNNDGGFTFWLFDLENDPYETTNLYDSDEDAHKTAKEDLYTLLQKYANNSYEMTYDFTANRKSFVVWKEHNNYMVPYTNSKDLQKAKGTFPEDCYSSGNFDETEAAPTASPSKKSLPTSVLTFPVPSPTPPPTTEIYASEPTLMPFADPTDEPTPTERSAPTEDPTVAPTSPKAPTVHPTLPMPTEQPTTSGPTVHPTLKVDQSPTAAPTTGSHTLPTISTPTAIVVEPSSAPSAGSVPTRSAPTFSSPTASPTAGTVTSPTMPTFTTPTASSPTTLSIPTIFSDTSPTDATPTASSPTATSPTASSPTAASPTASSPTASSPTASSPTASSPTASSPTASSPTASSPTASSPTASSPTASSPTASSPTAASPIASTPTALSPTASAPTSATSPNTAGGVPSAHSSSLAGASSSSNLLEQNGISSSSSLLPADSTSLSSDVEIASSNLRGEDSTLVSSSPDSSAVLSSDSRKR